MSLQYNTSNRIFTKIKKVYCTIILDVSLFDLANNNTAIIKLQIEIDELCVMRNLG